MSIFQYIFRWVSLYRTLVIIDEQWEVFSDFIKPYISIELWNAFFSVDIRLLIQDFLSLISPLIEIVNMSLAQPEPPTIGFIYPYIRTCATFLLRESPSDDNWQLPKTIFSSNVRKQLQEDFAKLWSETPPNEIALSCVLDPRYKEMVIFTESEKSQIHDCLIKEIENNRKNYTAKKLKAKENINQEISTFSVSKAFEEKMRPTESLPYIDNTKDPNSIIQDYFSHDVDQNDTIDLSNWWNTHKSKYNELIPSVRKYCCIPSTATQRELAFATKPIPFYMKREKIEDNILEYCLLIRSNMEYVDQDSDEIDIA